MTKRHALGAPLDHAALKLAPGKHMVTVKKSGYKDWSREIVVQSGSDVQLTANLEQ